jgi:hypothetical protein
MGVVRASGHHRPDLADDPRPTERTWPSRPAPDPGHDRDTGSRPCPRSRLLHPPCRRAGLARCRCRAAPKPWPSATPRVSAPRAWPFGGSVARWALHGALALTVLIPLLVDIHPRMASHRAGRDSIHRRAGTTRLLGLNYGAQTPLVSIATTSPTTSPRACCSLPTNAAPDGSPQPRMRGDSDVARRPPFSQPTHRGLRAAR